jgi:hypothetical protein
MLTYGRCDMAMLICEDILEKTWGGRLAPHGQPRANGQFWPPTIKVRLCSSMSEGRLKTISTQMEKVKQFLKFKKKMRVPY